MHYDSNISKALWLGVSILLFIAVVTIGLSVSGSMKDASAAANDSINSIAQSMAEEDLEPLMERRSRETRYLCHQ